MNRKENVVLITFRCHTCNKLGGGCKVVDYADTLVRLMAPLGWHEHIDATPGNTRMVSFNCPKCHGRESACTG